LLLTRVITAAALIAALLTALFFFPKPFFQALVAGFVAAAAFEWARLSGLARRPLAILYASGCVLACVGALTWRPLEEPLLCAASLFWIIGVPLWLSRGLLPGPRGALLLAGVVVLVPAGVAMAALAPRHLLWLVGLSVIADSAAYFAGRAFGRRKLAPAISPGKTWEGVAGGVVACIFYAIILTMFDPGLGARVTGVIWVPFIAAVILLCALSVLGDLCESALKRRAGVKDSGTLLPGHGGALDRVDSATAVLPVGALLLHWIGLA
jgi:phosphatidate cytidylyltransferase